MKELAVILSHAETDDKVNLLEQSIEHLLLQGKKILVSSHIPIPEYLIDKVDYVVYDKENPLIRNDEYENHFNIVYVWSSYPGYHQDFPIEFNHAFAVHKLIVNACSLAQSNGYDVIHFINYDYVIKDPKVLMHHSTMLNFYDVISYDWFGYGTNHRECISSAFFSVKVNPFYQKMINVRTKEDYCKFGSPIYEDFLFTLCNGLQIYNIPIKDLMDDNNIVAAKSILDNFLVNLEDGTTVSTYISKEDEQYYLFLSTATKRIALVDGVEFETSLVTILAITEERLQSGISVEFSELGIKRILDKKTPVALAKISEKGLINYKLTETKVKKYTIEKYCDETIPKRWDIINFLYDNYNFKDYLEIGVNDGTCIRLVNIPHKDGVDPFPGGEIGGCYVPEVNYEMTSDDFFNNHIKQAYDVIFIDGLHHSDQVDKDIQNALRYLNDSGFIILHDCNPPEYEVQIIPRQTGIWNGDVWKSIVKLRCQRPDLVVSVIDTDWGIGVVRRGSQELLQYDTYKCLDWKFFDENRDEILNIISVDDFYKKYKNYAR